MGQQQGKETPLTTGSSKGGHQQQQQQQQYHQQQQSSNCSSHRDVFNSRKCSNNRNQLRDCHNESHLTSECSEVAITRSESLLENQPYESTSISASVREESSNCQSLEISVDPYSDLKLLRHIVDEILKLSPGLNRLHIFHDFVLSAFYEKLVESNNSLIASETTLCLNKLIQNEIQLSTWDNVLSICEYVASNFNMAPSLAANDLLIADDPFPQQFHELLTTIEGIDEKGRLVPSSKCKLFSIVERCWRHRPVASVQRLIRYRIESISPVNEAWIRQLSSLVDKYFSARNLSSIRKAALSSVASVVKAYRQTHEETLINNIVIPYLKDVDQEADLELRTAAVRFLADLMLTCRSARICCDLVDVIKKILERSLVDVNTGGVGENRSLTEEADSDVKAAIGGLIAVVRKNLYTMPSAPATTSFNLIITHLNAHYCNNSNLLSQKSSYVRQEILELLLSIRANALHQIGFCRTSDRTLFSTHVKCTNDSEPVFENNIPESQQASGSTTPQSVSLPESGPPCATLSLRYLFDVLLLALNHENDLNILKKILTRLPQFLQNKAAVYLTDPRRIVNSLCEIFVSLVSEKFKSVKESFRNVPSNLMKSEFQGYVYPNLIALIAYQEVLEAQHKKNLVRQLESGFMTQPRQCIPALILCITEMQDVMVKLIPDIVLSLSKISATVNLAIPKLEFLSHLILWPRLSSSFTQDQYMSIFAIVLPYTNHDKFDDYTVTMAYKVISMWFLQCRLPLRKHLVQFIIKGLQANVMQPAEDNMKDDELRKRSGSLNMPEKRSAEVSRLPGSAQVPLSPHPSSAVPSPPAPNQHSTSVFSFPVSTPESHYSSSTSSLSSRHHRQTANVLHHELIDTCMDLLTKYTFGNCSTVPQKHPVADILLDRKQSYSWLIGQKIITITTSGCGGRVSHNGMCEECNHFVRSLDKSLDGPTNDEVAHYMSSEKPHTKSLYRSESAKGTEFDSTRECGFSTRKRHQSELSRHTSAQQSPRLVSRAYDDSTLKSNVLFGGSTGGNICSCWCQGWAEIFTRTPTGNTSWIMRIQNRLNLSSAFTDLSASDVTWVYNSKDADMDVRTTDPATGKEPCGNVDVRSFSTPPSFKRASSSPEIERNAEPSTFAGPTEVTEIETKEANESGSRNDSVEVGEPKTVLETSWKNGNGSQTVGISKVATVASASPIKAHNSSASVERRSSFSKSKPKLDLSINLQSANFDYSSSPSPSPLKPSSPSVSCKTPQKTTPSKLDHISEQNYEGRPERRHYTISVMSPAQKANIRRQCVIPKGNEVMPKSSSLNPEFVFLQLYYSTSFTPRDRPVLLPKTEVIDRAVSVLDYISPYETHKIGVVYIGPQQINDKVAILSNKAGSIRYSNFLKGLGKLIRLTDVDPTVNYVGGLSSDGSDGQFAYCWQDNLTQVIFHVATLMPTKEKDLQCNEKKRHIGNDFVVIVYNESGEDFNLSTIKGDGQFIYACIVITPMEYQANLIALQTRSDLTDIIGHQETIVLSDTNLPQFVRQLALHANLASVVFKARSQTPSNPYVSNSVERLRKIKGVLQKANEYNASQRNTGFSYGPTPSPNKSTFTGLVSAEYEEFSTNHAGCHYSFPDDFTNYV